MYSLHLLLGNDSLHVLKYSLQYPEVRIFTYLVQKYSHEMQIIQHLTHFGPTLTWSGLHTIKKGDFGIVLVGKI